MIYLIIYFAGVLFSYLRMNANYTETAKYYGVNDSDCSWKLFIIFILVSWVGFFGGLLMYLEDKYFFKLKPWRL